MKKFCLCLLLMLAAVAGPQTAKANQPPPETSLAERVDLASNIIVGTAKKVRVVEMKDGQLREVLPEPEQLDQQLAEIEIEVEEVLYPAPWKPKTTIRYLFGGGFFEVAPIREGTVGVKLIYLMSSLRSWTTKAEYEAIRNKSEEDVFVPAYGWNLVESLTKKDEIAALIEARVKREAEEKAKAATAAK